MNLRIYCMYHELDKIFAILGIIFSVVMIGYFIDKITYSFTGILILISCIIWLLIRNNPTLEFNSPSLNLENLKLSSSFFIIFTLSILSIYLRPVLYERPLIYYILVSIMGGIVALEIMYSQKMKCYSILFQIIIIGISIAWSQLLIFPSLLGVDPWYHQALTSEIISSNFIPSGYGYSKLPLFHLVVALTSLITGLDYKYSTMLSASLGQILCNCLFIFLLGKFLFKNSKVGLLASLFLVISNYNIYMSYWIIPNSFAGIFIPIMLYLSFRMINKMKMLERILLILFMTALILTHSLTAMCMAIILLISWLASKFHQCFSSDKKLAITLNFSILFSTVMFSWWMFASGHIGTLAKLIKFGFSQDILIHSPIEMIFENKQISLETFIQILGPHLFFALSIIGLLYMVSKNGNYFTFNMSFVGSAPLIIAFFSIIAQRGIIESRWLYFAQLLLSIPLAVAIILICNNIKKPSFKPIFLAFITMTIIFLMIITYTAGVDNQMFSPNISARAALTSAELQAIQKVSHISDRVIKTDNYFALSQSYEYNTKPFDAEVYYKNFEDLDGNLILIRDDIINKPFRIFSSTATINYNLKYTFTQIGYLKMYDCGSVSGFLKF